MPRSGTVPSLLFAACAVLATHGAFAATKEPPYEAVVESDEAFARCGPGKNFYPTGKLTRGDHVTVRRHDPGGWFMIDPPPGSFSLIRSDDVNRQGDFGTVKPLADGQSPVRIGSAIDPTIDSVYQRQLSSGERVEILGEATLPRRDAQIQMLKIRPPKGEFRWIDGMSLIPVDQQIHDEQIRDRQARVPRTKEKADSDPFAAAPRPRKNAPSKVGPSVPGKPTLTPTERPITTQRPASLQTGTKAGTTIAASDPDSRLNQIDLEFRDMIQRQPATWNLASIEQAYRELSQQAVSPAIRTQLELRFSAIDHYRHVKGEYDDYFRLVSATARKDAELAAIQNSLDPQDTRPPIAPPGQIPSASEQSASGVPQVATSPATPLPAQNVPNAQAPLNGPAFSAPAERPANPPSETRAAGPVLENPVPLPTEPEPESRPKSEMRREAPLATQPGVAPNNTPNPSQELPANPQAAPRNQGPISGPAAGPIGNAVDTPVRAAPSNNVYQPPARNGAHRLRNPDDMPQGPQPVPTSTMPASPPLRQEPSTQADPALEAPRQIRPQAAGGLDGAGIVQRAATPIPGGPRHVLLAPNGRILAYLYPDRGINLDTYLGRSMGIVGARSYRSELRTDLIVVRGMVPVRLAP